MIVQVHVYGRRSNELIPVIPTMTERTSLNSRYSTISRRSNLDRDNSKCSSQLETYKCFEAIASHEYLDFFLLFAIFPKNDLKVISEQI